MTALIFQLDSSINQLSFTLSSAVIHRFSVLFTVDARHFWHIWLLGSSRNAILFLCAHAQGVRAPLTIAPRPRLLYRLISIDDRSRPSARASQESHRSRLADSYSRFS